MSYRASRRLIIIGVVVCALFLAFILVLPEVVRRLAVSRLDSIFTEPSTIENVDVNLFTGRAAVDNLVIGNESAPMLRLPSVKIEFSRGPLFLGKLDLQEIVLEHPQLRLERLGPAKYNIVSALRKSDNSNGQGQASGFSINDLKIRDGQIVFIDHVQKPVYRTTFSSLDLTAGPISTLAGSKITPTDFNVGVKVADGTVRLTGSATPFQDSLNVKVKAAVSNVQLRTFGTYFPYGGRLDLKNSLLNGAAQYVLAHRQGKVTEHNIAANVSLSRIALLSASESQPLVQLQALKAQDVHIDLLSQQAQIGSLVIANPYLRIERDSSGFNFAQLIPESKAENNNAPSQKNAGNEFAVVLKRIEANGGTIRFVDQTVNPAVDTTLQNLRLVAGGWKLSPIFSADHIDANADVGDGSLQVNGALQGTPLQGTLAIDGQDVPFQPLSSYVDQLFTAARSSGGSLDGKLTLAFAPNGDEPGTSISGQVVGNNMALAFADERNAFFKAKQLGVNLKSIQIGSNPQVDIDRIRLSGARLQVVREKDSKLNLAKLWASEKKPASEPGGSKKQDSGSNLKIHSISIDQSRIAILDRTVSPNFRTTISQLSANISEILPDAKPAKVDLKGVLGNNATLALNGNFTPFSAQPSIELEGTIKSYALPGLNPYATEYVDHRIQRGQLTTDVKYTLNGDQLQANAEIVLRDVHVGEKTGDEFQKRIGIPLSLAVALLQDVSGVIHLQVDVTGDTGPRVNIRSLVWAAVRNAIVKAITSPFRLVGKIFTAAGKIGRLKIEPIRFEPGTATIAEGSSNQVGDLVKLLNQKPRLELKLQGEASDEDRDALRKKVFWERLQSTEGKDYEAALVRLYQKLGGTAKTTTPLPAETENRLEKFVMEHVQPSPADLRALARQRAETVKNALTQRGVGSDRVAVAGSETSGQTPAVQIQLAS